MGEYSQLGRALLGDRRRRPSEKVSHLGEWKGVHILQHRLCSGGRRVGLVAGLLRRWPARLRTNSRTFGEVP